MKDRDRRRLLEIQKRPRTLQAALRPEHEAFLSQLTIDALKWLNRQHQRQDVQADEVLRNKVTLEARRLSDLDRRGLLREYWWCEWAPSDPQSDP